MLKDEDKSRHQDRDGETISYQPESQVSLMQFYEITSAHNTEFGEKVRQLLQMGCDRLGVECGIFSRIQDETYEIVVLHDQSQGPHMPRRYTIDQTYCRQTILAKEPLYFIHASDSDWGQHPAYKTFGFEAYLGVAVKVEGQPYGTFTLASRTPRRHQFTTAEKALVQLMARWVGDELERSCMETSLSLRMREMAALYDISLDINAQPDLSTLLEAIVARATMLLETGRGGISLVKPDQGVLELVAGHNRSGSDNNPPLQIAIGEGLSGRVAQTGEPLMVVDYRNWEGKSPLFADREIGRILGVPLLRREQVLGVLSVFDEQAGVFTHDDVRLLCLLAAQAATAIDNTRLNETGHRRAEQLDALRQLSLDLTITRAPDVLLQQIVERAVELLQGDSGGVNLYRPEQEVLERVAAVGRAAEWIGAQLVKGEGVAGKVWATGQSQLIEDYGNWSGRSPQMRDVSGPTVATPIQWGDEFLGVLVIRRIADDTRFTEEDAALLSQFATHAAIAINNARLYGHAQQEITERERAEKQLRSSLKEKEILLQEVNHRVKNNLQVISSLLRVQARSIEDQKVRQLFKESQSRVETMSLIHERLYKSEDLAQIDFATYIGELARNLVQSYEIGSNVTVELDVDGIFLELERAIPCGLIINELVTNALKYAFPMGDPGHIMISLKPQPEGGLELTVKDNGIGLTPDFDLQNTGSLGLQLVGLLTDQLGGTLSVVRRGGTIFTITLPNTV